MPKKYLHLISKRRKNRIINLQMKSYNLSNELSQNTATVAVDPPILPNSPGTTKALVEFNCNSDFEVTTTDLYDDNFICGCDVTITTGLNNGDECFSERMDDVPECSIENLDVRTINKDLSNWVVEHNIPHVAVNSLLSILKYHGHLDLPNDVRTLMKTPRVNCINKSMESGGKYAHFGFSCGIERSVKKYFYNCPNFVKVNLNIDGLPLYKSSGSQFWPIMASVVADFYTEPFMVGIYHGTKKPKDVNEFLRPMVNEARNILNNGLIVDNKKIDVSINAIICDAPAKAFITCTKGHSGYFGCLKCVQEGDFVENRVIFPETNCTMRSDISFKTKQQPEHHTGMSCLEELNIGMVSQIPVDYMHLVCLGVMKRLLQFWVKGKMNVRLKSNVLEEVSENLIKLKSCITSEFARKPRSIQEIDRWKATELRQFLLYTGPVVLKRALPSNYYLHFLCLSTAIRILVDSELCTSMNDYAHSLLLWFIKHYSDLYGYEFLSYNVHNLSHLCADVKIFGSLDNFSSFKYENYMQKIKQKLKHNGKPLEQIVNRLSEERQFPIKTSYSQQYPIIHYSYNTQPFQNDVISFLEFNGFSISKKEFDNCCLLNDGSVAVVHDVYLENGIVMLSGQQFLNIKPFFLVPCDSQKLGIFTVSTTKCHAVTISATKISKKCLMIECFHQNDEYVVVPLLHCNN